MLIFSRDRRLLVRIFSTIDIFIRHLCLRGIWRCLSAFSGEWYDGTARAALITRTASPIISVMKGDTLRDTAIDHGHALFWHGGLSTERPKRRMASGRWYAISVSAYIAPPSALVGEASWRSVAATLHEWRERCYQSTSIDADEN